MADFNSRPVHFGDLNEIFDERGSTFLAMRLTQWVKAGAEPDESKAKLELRKWMVKPDGEEQANKGFSFLTEEGPHELVNVLTKNGYGRTKEILLNLKKRDDFKESVEHLYDDEDTGDNSGEYFDMRDILLTEDPNEGDDDE